MQLAELVRCRPGSPLTALLPMSEPPRSSRCRTHQVRVVPPLALGQLGRSFEFRCSRTSTAILLPQRRGGILQQPRFTASRARLFRRVLSQVRIHPSGPSEASGAPTRDVDRTVTTALSETPAKHKWDRANQPKTKLHSAASMPSRKLKHREHGNALTPNPIRERVAHRARSCSAVAKERKTPGYLKRGVSHRLSTARFAPPEPFAPLAPRPT